VSDANAEALLPDQSLSAQLMTTKTTARRQRVGSVSRREVIDRARRSDARLVAVTAPAGYGKSTMLAEWAALDDRPTGWATVDGQDDDPVALLTLLAVACADISSRALEVALEMGSVGAGVLGRSAPMLAGALRDAPLPFVLFVDDIHAASSDACRDVLEVILGGVPEGSQIVLASRHEQPYLGRLRAEGMTFEITTNDLLIDREGAKTIFRGADARVSDDDIDLAVDRCEGWATGLFLCALAVNAGADVHTIGGGERFVADYLYGEALRGLPGEVREFLRRTAMLDQLSAPLCDAVLERGDSQSILRALEARNVFIVALDGHRQWFRYHALFRDFLLTELAAAEGARATQLHRRAAAWYIGDGSPQRAVGHLLAAGDRSQAGELVTELAVSTVEKGRVDLVERWLTRLGAATIESSPELVSIAAWIAMLQGQSPAAERWAAALESARSDSPTSDGAGALAASQAMVRVGMWTGTMSTLLDDAHYAAAVTPEWSRWRAPSLYLLGAASLLGGDVDAAKRALLACVATSERQGNTVALILSQGELSVLGMDGGDTGAALRHAEAAISTIESYHMDGYPTAAVALAARARVALRQGDAVATRRFLARAMRARIHCTHVLPFLAIRSRLQLAKVFAATGEAASARQLLNEIDALLLIRPHVGALADQVTDFRQALGDDTGQVLGLPLTPAEMRLLPYLQTHLMIAEIGQRLFISRNTVSTEVKSIYRKLGVTTRSAAVARAVELGLLGE
jgi:LuxR family maltose regulon positive regulatory protein